MKHIAALAIAAAVFAVPAVSLAGGEYARSSYHAPVYQPAPCAPAPQYQPAAAYCAPAPACPTPCFNPLSIVGGVVTGVGSAIGAVGQGISGAFGSCNPCY